mmetsp:Transcript_14649/g.22656  ORF Transcript_14649/g.22656 Transcript_14649/m.22656 type:complete len:416 (-) Transcript_14649:138-1385(-)
MIKKMITTTLLTAPRLLLWRSTISTTQALQFASSHTETRRITRSSANNIANNNFRRHHCRQSHHGIGSTASNSNDNQRTNTIIEEEENDDHDANILGGISLLEHVNINIPDHSNLDFYTKILGMGLDPRRAANVVQGSGTVWANCGASQFHLPYGDTAQVIPGSIGLAFSSLQPLKDRLTVADADASSPEKYQFEIGTDERSGREYVKLHDGYGNVIYARERAVDLNTDVDTMKQPILSGKNVEEFGEAIASEYGRDETDCIGIDYVEFRCPRGTVPPISEFYECALGAVVDVVQDGADDVAIVCCGKISASGRPTQCLIFRESDEPTPPYDGHHVAMYVGDTKDDFEHVYKNCEKAGVVWVNPRFSDKATSLEGAKRYKQFRFKDILDLETGKTVFTLEHEMRSVEHSAWPGKR